MRKIILSNLVSLDGFFEGPDKELDWFVTDEEFFEYVRDMFNTVDTILFGRITYQMMSAYWPSASDNDPVITGYMNNLPKIVFSKTLENAPWGKWDNTRIVHGNISEEIQKLKKQPGKDMVIFGSGGIVSAFASLGLIDEYRIIVNPVILGKGNPLFKDINRKINLKLVKTKVLKTGVVLFHYEPEKIKNEKDYDKRNGK